MLFKANQANNSPPNGCRYLSIYWKCNVNRFDWCSTHHIIRFWWMNIKNEWRVVQFSLVTCMQSIFAMSIMCFNWLNVCISVCVCVLRTVFSVCLFIWFSAIFLYRSVGDCTFLLLFFRFDSMVQTTLAVIFQSWNDQIAARFIYSKVHSIVCAWNACICQTGKLTNKEWKLECIEIEMLAAVFIAPCTIQSN